MIGVLVQRGNLDTETEIHMRKTIGADRLRKEAVVYKLRERPGAAPSLRHFDLIHFCCLSVLTTALVVEVHESDAGVFREHRDKNPCSWLEEAGELITDSS